jgi:hypothetical protein
MTLHFFFFQSYVGSWTRTDRALVRAKQYLDSGANRAGVPNVVVVLTDGNTNDGGESLLPTAAANLKNVPDTTVICSNLLVLTYKGF